MNFLARLFHRHRWALHSHSIARGPFYGYTVTATLQCQCGERQLLRYGSDLFHEPFDSPEQAMCWLRAQCHDTVPDGVPPDINQKVKKP